jgi:uncharacterized protein
MPSNTELLQEFEDRMVAGDTDYVLTLLDDDIVVHECDHVPYPGDHRGKDGFMKLAEAFHATWEITSELGLEIFPAGDEHVLTRVRFDAIGKATGKSMTVRIAELYRIKDGKLADIDVFYKDAVEVTAVTGDKVILQGAAA